MKPLLCLAILSCLFLPAFGLYVQPEIKDVPLKRLLANLTARVEAKPGDASAHHHLARAHAMAYARKLADAEAVKSWAGWQGKGPLQPWFGFEPPHLPFQKVAATNDPGKLKAARAHLAAAIASYRKALAAKPDTTIKLGLAWCRDQAGNKKAALAGYRDVAAAAWKSENKSGAGGLKPFVFVETAGYLLPLLDATTDAAEIKDIEARRKKLLALPRAVTPLVVPLTAHATDLASLIDSEARVRFDLDGTGRQLEWPWIAPSSAWLVYDPRNTGRITSALQMFGTRSFLLFCSDGYEALALLDDDRDGSLRGPELKGLALWRDRDADGISSSGEVKPVTEFGITSLSTRGEPHQSGIPYSPAGVTFDDGTTRPTYDLVLESR